MRRLNSSNKILLFTITAISPIFALIALYSLLTPWVSGKLLVVGKTITAFDFPNVFWSVLIGCLAVIIVYVQSILSGEFGKRRGVILALAAATLLAAGYFLYVYSQKPSIPGVKVSLRGGLLLCFASLVLSFLGSVVPMSILSPNKRESSPVKIVKSKPDQSENQPEQ